MEHPTTVLRIGDWRVDPRSGQLARDGETVRLEARTLRLLLHLAEHAGEVVSIDDLLKHVWAGVIVTSDSVYQGVASLRRVLGDDPRRPMYIATVPRLGYRMVAAVEPWVDPGIAPTTESSQPDEDSPNPATAVAPRDGPSPVARRKSSHVRLVLAIGALVCLVIAVTIMLHGALGRDDRSATASARPAKSIAVLPFLDLTDDMNEEPFADGITEELIGKLSKVPGLRVPAPTSSFYFKGKRVPIADIARKLGVAYVLDGSVRKSGARLRVAARLVRADDGYVAWAESYDRPIDDMLMVQDDIAGEVTKALTASIVVPTESSPIPE